MKTTHQFTLPALMTRLIEVQNLAVGQEGNAKEKALNLVAFETGRIRLGRVVVFGTGRCLGHRKKAKGRVEHRTQ